MVGCTAAVDARDNTETTYTSTTKGVPIYWLNGAKAADQYEDFYDGSWDDEANDKNESGTDGPDTSVTAGLPRTGCEHNGTEAFLGQASRALGNSSARVGRPNSSNANNGPLSSGNVSTSTDTRPMYGLSALFQVSANSAPTVANAIPDQTAGVGALFTYQFPTNTFNDTDTSDTLSYTATKADGMTLPTWLGFTASTRTFTGTPTASDVETVAVKVTATDTSSATVSDEFNIVVADTTPPTLSFATVLSTGSSFQFGFSENVDLFNVPPASAFTATADGSPVTISNVAQAGSAKLSARVSPFIRQGQTVVVTYTDPTAGDDANAIQDTAGNDAASFTTGVSGVPAVTNISTLATTVPAN